MPQALRYDNLVIPIRGSSGPSTGKFVPVCFSRMPNEALSGLPLYMRSVDAAGRESFTLYAGAGVKFTPEQRLRLETLGISFIHIREEDQPKLRRQLEEKIEGLADDSSIELAIRCEIIYESSLELIDETYATREMSKAVPRLRRVARSIVSLYNEDPKTFGYFFTAARHDACLSTHAGNAAVWLPALARQMGETKPTTLTALCLGAMLYDIGMACLPPAIVQHARKLNTHERQQVLQHSEIGAQMMRATPDLDPFVIQMALQHHERLDGSGYPRKHTFEQIPMVARMAAVVDTFDALTSFRPHREQGISPAGAIMTLQNEAPNRYDRQIVESWTSLLRGAFPELLAEMEQQKKAPAKGRQRRQFERFVTNCPATLGMLALAAGDWTEMATLRVVAHNLSRGGLGILSRQKLNTGEYFRARLETKGAATRTLTGIIVRVRDRGDGWFEAGARFVDLAQEAAPPPAEDVLPAQAAGAPEEAMLAGDFVEPEKPVVADEGMVAGDFVEPVR